MCAVMRPTRGALGHSWLGDATCATSLTIQWGDITRGSRRRRSRRRRRRDDNWIKYNVCVVVCVARDFYIVFSSFAPVCRVNIFISNAVLRLSRVAYFFWFVVVQHLFYLQTNKKKNGRLRLRLGGGFVACICFECFVYKYASRAPAVCQEER